MGVQEQNDITTDVVTSFDNTFENENLVDTFSQVGEFAIDQAIKNDVLKDVPLFGLLISGYKTIVNVKDYNLTRKVYRFLYNLRDTTPDERRKFSKKYCEANQEKTAVLIKAVINEQLTTSQFNRLIMAILRTAFTDLKQLAKYQKEYDEEGLTDSLLAAGLIYQSTYDGGHADNEDSDNKFLISSNGALLLNFSRPSLPNRS